jgi:hypothetical protein
MENDNSSVSQDRDMDKTTDDVLSDTKDSIVFDAQESSSALVSSKPEESHTIAQSSEKMTGIIIGIVAFTILITSMGVVGFFFLWDGDRSQEDAESDLEEVSVSSDESLIKKPAQLHVDVEMSQIEQNAAIYATTVAVILCLEDDGYVMDPVDGMPLCRDGGVTTSDTTWPALDQYGARWGGCEMVIERMNTQPDNFTYCATLSDGMIVTCTENGCHADDEVSAERVDRGSGSSAGTSYADEQLARDALSGVVAKMTTLGCAEYESHTSQIIVDMFYDPENTNKRMWTERWTASGCGKKFPIDIKFTETREAGTVWTIE